MAPFFVGGHDRDSAAACPSSRTPHDLVWHSRSRPGAVAGELRSFLACGILSRGFARVHCRACSGEEPAATATSER